MRLRITAGLGLRISAVLTLLALALMCWSLLVPTPLPVMLYVPRFVPVVVIANTRAESPESLCTQSTFELFRLAAIPDASVIEVFAMVPV